ncbi:hypothetical protein AVEN_205711-1 [Araneus ventricosus]|uniref:Uncharacterized protein n=1 Tax=Araneus ventricosus TaxID=182803 RepID=A0A4Y2V7Y5_ARAVE|nr:hypothetical protein AVEN_173746-1 [Araneus ventricosus]GBO19790.1 hypothetical protein AVEN_205711-1 [Araneus ventricosus]
MSLAPCVPKKVEWITGECPAFKQHEGYFGMDLLILNQGQMMRTTPDIPSSKLPHHTSGRTFDIRCQIQSSTILHTRRIFSGIGFQPIALILRDEGGRGGLVVMSRPQCRRVPGNFVISNPDSTEGPPCMGPVAR